MLSQIGSHNEVVKGMSVVGQHLSLLHLLPRYHCHLVVFYCNVTQQVIFHLTRVHPCLMELSLQPSPHFCRSWNFFTYGDSVQEILIVFGQVVVGIDADDYLEHRVRLKDLF